MAKRKTSKPKSVEPTIKVTVGNLTPEECQKLLDGEPVGSGPTSAEMTQQFADAINAGEWRMPGIDCQEGQHSRMVRLAQEAIETDKGEEEESDVEASAETDPTSAPATTAADQGASSATSADFSVQSCGEPDLTVGTRVRFIGPDYDNGLGISGVSIGRRGVIIEKDGHKAKSYGGPEVELVTVRFDRGEKPVVLDISRIAPEDEQRSDPTMPQEATGEIAPSAVASGSLASRLTAMHRKRQPGEQVAGMVPNEEQECILFTTDEVQALLSHRVVVICAGAGAGKTSVLRMLEQTLRGMGQYTAFNKSLVEDSRPKFKRAAVHTTYALAYRAVGKDYGHRLNGDRVRSWQIAKMLGIEDYRLLLKGAGAPDADGKPTDAVKLLKADFLAGQAMEALKRFSQGVDLEPGGQHIWSVAISPFGSDAMQQFRTYLLPFVLKAWEDIRDVNGKLPFQHIYYVKLWQMGQGDKRPIIPADYILLDEAQDTPPVVLDILERQTHAMLVVVGDDNQQIYEWLGAVNALAHFPNAPRCLLSQSYRFGQAGADVANSILATLDEPTDLVMRGNPDIPSRVCAVAEPRCHLFRTNAGAVATIMKAVSEGKRPHLIGGGADTVAWCQAALDLQEKRGTRHPDLCCFDSWGEVKEYSKQDEGSDLRLMVKLVDQFGAQAIIDSLRDMPKEEDADLICSTAHKSKGREWDTVKLGPDFLTANRMNDSDRRLLYVAATRFKLCLDVTECPPFCGGEYTAEGGETRRAPGLEIHYTQPMPSAEDQAEWLSLKECKAVPIINQQPMKIPTAIIHPGSFAWYKAALAAGYHDQDPPPDGWMPGDEYCPRASKAIRDATAGKFTWTNYGGAWCARGPINVAVGTEVEVERKDGTKTKCKVKAVVKQWDDAWVYSV